MVDYFLVDYYINHDTTGQEYRQEVLTQIQINSLKFKYKGNIYIAKVVKIKEEVISKND